MENNRSLTDIKNDISIITSNKLNVYQSKLLFIGIIYEIVLRKDLFPKNENLKVFINEIILSHSKTMDCFRDYLYDSRTLLSARVQSIIIKEFEYTDIIDVVNKLNILLPDANLNKRKLSETEIRDKHKTIEWMKFLGEDKK